MFGVAGGGGRGGFFKRTRVIDRSPTLLPRANLLAVIASDSMRQRLRERELGGSICLGDGNAEERASREKGGG